MVEKSAGGRESTEAGYNLVVLLVAITVLNIMIAAMLPVWSTWAQREKEEELLFRGMQYAEAIRVFQKRFGRLPIKLEEFIEVEPRSIRQLWTDPMTGEVDWVPIIQGQVNTQAGGGQPPNAQNRSQSTVPTTDPAGSFGQPPQAPQGPILGVHSRSTDSSLKMFRDQTQYDQWNFDLYLLQSPVGLGPAAGAGLAKVSAATIGRPFRVPTPQSQGNNSNRPPVGIGGFPPGGRSGGKN